MIAHEQIEKTRAMFVMKDLIMEYNQVAVQFGFVTIFLCGFPGGPLLCYILNYLDLNMFNNTMTNYLKRNVTKNCENIGVWQEIFDIMGFLALVMNPAILFFTIGGYDGLFGSNNN